MSVIRMLHSVDEYVAGEDYEIDGDTADRFIALGYAEGDIAGHYTADQWRAYVAEEQAKHQAVDLGG